MQLNMNGNMNHFQSHQQQQQQQATLPSASPSASAAAFPFQSNRPVSPTPNQQIYGNNLSSQFRSGSSIPPLSSPSSHGSNSTTGGNVALNRDMLGHLTPQQINQFMQNIQPQQQSLSQSQQHMLQQQGNMNYRGDDNSSSSPPPLHPHNPNATAASMGFQQQQTQSQQQQQNYQRTQHGRTDSSLQQQQLLHSSVGMGGNSGSNNNNPPLPTSDLQSNNWSLAQVQQLQQQILQLSNIKAQVAKQEQQFQQQGGFNSTNNNMNQQQQNNSNMNQQQQQQQQNQSSSNSHFSPSPLQSMAPRLSRLPNMVSVNNPPPPSNASGRTPISAPYEESPVQSTHSLSLTSPLSRFNSVSSTMSSTFSFGSPYDSSRSHSRSISSLNNNNIASLNPMANEFNPNFSNPTSPTATNSPSTTTRMQPGRATSSTPVMGSMSGSMSGSLTNSVSPPSSVPSATRSLDNSLSMGVLSPMAQIQQQQLIDEKLATMGLPSQPFDARELDAQVGREREDHAAYIYNFRVQVCQGYLDGTCPYDSYTCFQTHAKIPRRRKPILQHGRFNYIPTRCRYVIEEKECPQSYMCRFSHVTEEVIYHSSKFKTQLCSHPLDKDGRCAGYGAHCAKAHGPLDLRQPLFESTDDSQQKAGPLEMYDFVVPPAQREMERKYFMYVYKTHRCLGFPFNCSCDGLDSHRPEEARRGPIIKYAPMACPNVKPYLNADWSKPNVDCSGRFKPKIIKNGQLVPQESDEWDCEYAHTLLELMYHPIVYKSSLCDHFDPENPTTWKCVWKRRCAHAHGRDDIRSKEEATEDWKMHLLSAFPNATQLPNLTRLLNAGQQALESLNSSQNKSRMNIPVAPLSTINQTANTSANISPPQSHGSLNLMQQQQQQQHQANNQSLSLNQGAMQSHVQLQHRRSITSSILREQQLALQQQQQLQGRTVSASSSLTQGNSSRATNMHLNFPFSAPGSDAPSPQGSPMNHSQSGRPASSLVLSGSSVEPSPRAIAPGGPTPKTSTAGSFGLTGFFSGSDSGMWAPSPKVHNASAPSAPGLAPSPAQSRTVSEDPAAAAWAEPDANNSFNSRSTHASNMREDSSKSSNEDVYPHMMNSLDVVAAPPQLPMASSDNNNTLSATNAHQLWTSPTAAAVADANGPTNASTTGAPLSSVQAELLSHLHCAYTDESTEFPGQTEPHLLHAPVSTTCCGLSFCQDCVEAHINRCKTSHQFIDSDAQSGEDAIVAVCVCGHQMNSSELDELRHLPLQQSLNNVCEWIKLSDHFQSQSGSGDNSIQDLSINPFHVNGINELSASLNPLPSKSASPLPPLPNTEEVAKI